MQETEICYNLIFFNGDHMPFRHWSRQRSMFLAILLYYGGKL